MSNNDKTKFDADDEYDAIFAHSDRTSSPAAHPLTSGQETGPVTEEIVTEAVVMGEGVPSRKAATEPFPDSDDDSVDVGDIEDGIFAEDTRSARKPRRVGGILGAVAVLAAAGAGGFFYVTAQAPVEGPQATEIQETAPVPENQVATGQGATIAQVDPAQVVPNPTPETPAPTSTSDSPSPSVSTGVAAADVATDVAVPTTPVTPPASVSPASVTPTPAPSVVPVPDTATLSAPSPAVVSAPSPVAVGAKADVKTPENKVESKAEKDTSKGKIVMSAEEKKRIADEKLDQYFDSPSGKILKSIPAPSMDPRKGSQESIIVVTRKPVASTIVGQKTPSHAAPRTGSHGKKAAVSIQTTDIDAKVIAADRALKLQRYDAAQEMYAELYRINPHDERVLLGRAVLFQKTGDTASAVSAYEDVLAEYPDNTQAIINLAGLIRQTSPAVALEKLLDLNQAYPGKPVVLAQLGVAYADAGNFLDAYKNLERAAALDPNNPQHYYNMAVVSEKAGDVPLAIRNYEKALEVDTIYGDGRGAISRERIYDRLSKLRGN